MITKSLLNKISSYRPNPQALKAIQRVPTILLVGISGAGKNTIIADLLARHASSYRLIISHTTRAPRKNKGIMERDGVDYHFIDFKTAEHMLDTQAYIEANLYSGNIYGISVAEVQEAQSAGKVALGDLEVQGARDLIRLLPSAKIIFVLPPNYDEWQRRLLNRYGTAKQEYAEDLKRRLQTAKRELEYALSADHLYLVVNDRLEKSVARVEAIAQETEVDHRPPQAVTLIKQLLSQLEA
jgi:guanylate kinase